MKSFPAYDGARNMGSIRYFWYVPVSDVDAVSDESDGEVDAITMVSGKKFYTGYATQDTMNYSEQENSGAQGGVFSQALAGFYPGSRSDVNVLFREMKEDRFILIFKDNNERYRILGNLDMPVRFKYSLDTMSAVAGRHGYAVSFYKDDINECPFFTGTFSTY